MSQEDELARLAVAIFGLFLASILHLPYVVQTVVCPLPSLPPSISHNWLAIPFCSDRKCALPLASPVSVFPLLPTRLVRCLPSRCGGERENLKFITTPAAFSRSLLPSLVRSYFPPHADIRQISGRRAREACVSFERLPSSPWPLLPPPLIAGFHLSPPRCNILKSQGVRSAESVNDGFRLGRTSHSVHARTARIGPEGFRRAACLLRNRFSLPKTRLSCKSLPAPVSEPHRSTVTCNRPKGISLVSGQYLMRCSPFWVVYHVCFVEAFFALPHMQHLAGLLIR